MNAWQDERRIRTCDSGQSEDSSASFEPPATVEVAPGCPTSNQKPRQRRAGGLKIAYLVNRYPRTSHSFIRREILAMESEGVDVLRFSLRPLDQELVSEADRQELARTRIVLDAGVLRHGLALVAVGARRPVALARALGLAFRLGWRSDRGLLRHAAYLAEACVLERWLRREHVDHLHAHFGTNSAAVALLCRAVGGPSYSFTVHGPVEFERPEALRLGEKVRHAAFAVAISSFGRAQLCRWSHFTDWPKLHVVRCGVDGEMLRPPSPTPSAPRLVCVARFSEAKGHMLLLEAAERLAAEGLAFEILLVGDGPLRPAVEEQVRAKGLQGHVRMAGWMSSAQVRDAIVSSRAMVLPSFAEGLPVVFMEAFALGRPVIASSIAGIPELVEAGVSGWLIPAGSVDALVASMRSALQATPEQLDAMGRAGAARVASDHDARNEARKLLALFRASIASAMGPAVSTRPPSASLT